MKKILLISYYWENDNSVGKQRWTNLISELRKNNYEIIVLTFSKREYIKKEKKFTLIEKKINSFYDFFSNKSLENYSKGIVDSSTNIFITILSWIRVNFFFPDGRLFFSKGIENYIVEFIKSKKVNILITTSPPHSIQSLGLAIKKRTKVKWISDFRDPYINWDILLNMNPTFISKKIHSFYQNSFLKNSDKVVVTNSELKNEFKKIIKKDNISLIPNGSNLKSLFIESNKFILSYFGLLNKLRNPKVLIDILEDLVIENKDFAKLFEFHLYGNIQKSTVNYISSKKKLFKRTNIYNYISEEKLNNKISSSSILILLLNNISRQNTTPYKIFDYLVSDMPILTLGNFKNNDVDFLLNKYQKKRRFNYNDKEGIKLFIIDSFNSFRLKKSKKMNLDYSNLRYKKICDDYMKVINSL